MSLVNPNIALGTRLPEFQPRNALADYAQIQQIQGGRQAQELNALKMQEAQAAMQERNALRQLNPAAEDYENQLFRVSPQLGIQYRKERSAADASNAAASASKATAAAARRKIFQQAQRDISGRPSDANITAHMEDVLESDLFNEQEKAEVVRNTTRLLSIPLAERGSYLASQGATAGELKPSVQQINQGGQTQVLRVPAFGGAPTSVGTFADVPMPAAVVAQKKDIAKAGAPNISMNTEKKFGEVFGSKVAEADVNKLATAESAPRLAESANRIIDIVSRGDVFTGPAADIKLNIARVLNVAGANNQDKIANTEQLIASTGQSTLDAIKGAGLGTGQGFTDKDLKFLQGIAGGTINLTAQTLTELATLQHRVATRAADAWSKRSKEIPKDVLAGTGISTEPIKVPPLASVMKRGALGIPQGAIDDLKNGVGTDAQFDMEFGPGAAARVRRAK
jgi:hypothetical protein